MKEGDEKMNKHEVREIIKEELLRHLEINIIDEKNGYTIQLVFSGDIIDSCDIIT